MDIAQNIRISQFKEAITLNESIVYSSTFHLRIKISEIWYGAKNIKMDRASWALISGKWRASTQKYFPECTDGATS